MKQVTEKIPLNVQVHGPAGCCWRTLAASALLASALTGQAAVVNFNTVGDYTSNFNDNDGSGTGEVASGGLSNSGAVDADQREVQVYNQGTFRLSAGPAQVSVFFQYSGYENTGGQAAAVLNLGFTSGLFDTYGTPANTSGIDITAGLRQNDAGSNSKGYNITLGNDENVGGATASPQFTLVDNNWYHLSLSLDGASGGDLIGVTAQLSNASASGAIGSSVAVLNDGGSGYTFANSLSSGESYAYFGNQFSFRGADILDNFSASDSVPEPSTLGLLGLSSLLLTSLRRRNASSVV